MQILSYGLGEWDADTLGNHRVLIRVENGPDSTPEAVRVHIPWRLRDRYPESHQMIMVDTASGQLINNLARLEVNREFAELVFQPKSGPGLYALYFMPYTGTVRAPYPQITYLKPQETADPQWLAACNLEHWRDLPQATALEIQSIDTLNSFYPMEVIATSSEIEALLAVHPSVPFLLFPEDREHSIRMTIDLPHRWIETGPGYPFRAKASQGEFYTFQLGVFAARTRLQNIQVEFTGLSNPDSQSIIGAKLFRCFNQGGVDWTGKDFRKQVSVEQGQVLPLWCGIEIPQDADLGEYVGGVSVSAAGIESQAVKLILSIQPEEVSDHGDNEPERLSRLRWLDSRIALDDDVVSPFLPIQVKESEFEFLGRMIRINETGFAERIVSRFSQEMTGFNDSRDILASPVRLVIEDNTGNCIPWNLQKKAQIVYQTPGMVRWNSTGNAKTLMINLNAELEADGNLEYTIKIHSDSPVRLGDIRLEVPYRRDVARYMLGLGFRGGYRPSEFNWKWDVQRLNQDSIWLGDVNAGLQITLKDENYSRPLNTNFYTLKPLVSPASWDNGGKGGIRLIDNPEWDSLQVCCYSGPRQMQPGDTLYYNFRLAVTPFKCIDTEGQWSTRYYHRYTPVDEIAATGANTINIHHANEINPFINYPFLRPDAMKTYIDQAHELGMKVKIYYTVRELTNHAPELYALRSLGDEVLAHGPGGGHSWLQEHLISNYVTGWHVYGLKDVAVVNSGTSRWHNFYLEGLDWLARNINIDGLYIDDLAFDRIVMKRVRKILDRRRPGALIDLHSANQFRERDGYANSANLYMEHFPYLNRLWFGEYFEYNLSPDYWLVEVSGIPFGLMGEMLQDGGNPWRGMIYGMTGRLPWSGNPRPLWKVWDNFGIQGSHMIGYWSERCPVKTGREDILATVYRKENRALIAIASWHPEQTSIRLTIDWNALGVDPEKALLLAPQVEDFQEEAVFHPGEEIPVEAGKGWLFILRCDDAITDSHKPKDH